ncbi:MAG: glycosyltransferase family 39 protein [Anaerolineaceae bacterium]|nr:glycosyltransferase family 39 protein [Anaerolineaceae bacterium]
MTPLSGSMQSRLPFWWLVLAPLLLAALLSSIQLDDNAFNRDEFKSLYSAGMYASGPGTLQEVWRHVEETRPNQSQGWSKLLFVWGRLVGWHEPAIRSLSAFAGLLTIAWLYRAGMALFSPQVALLAVLLSSASVFFLAYMAIARVFTLVALNTTLVLWSYWRLTQATRPAGHSMLAVLFASGAGPLYSHYFAALFLPALGIYHLLFVTRGRRWWQVSAALTLALLLALLQAPGFLNGLSLSREDASLADKAMTHADIPGRLIYALSNYLVTLQGQAGTMFVAVLLVFLLLSTWRKLRSFSPTGAVWLLSFVTATTFLFIVGANEVVRVIEQKRIRYMMSLFPPIALLAGYALRNCLRAFPHASAGLLVFWLFLGPVLVLNQTDFHAFRFSTTFHHVQRLLQERASVSDLVVLQSSLGDGEVLYLHPLYIPLSDNAWKTEFWNGMGPLGDALPVWSPYSSIWLIFEADTGGFGFTESNAPGLHLCERLDNMAGYTLERHARATSDCEPTPFRLALDRDIGLTGPWISLVDNVLRVEAGLRSADDYRLSHYSLALHVMDPRTGERVAQSDIGVGPGAFVAVGSDIDVSALAPGDYELHVALYDWQTGERLSARDLQTGDVSDMHVLQRFHVD